MPRQRQNLGLGYNSHLNELVVLYKPHQFVGELIAASKHDAISSRSISCRVTLSKILHISVHDQVVEDIIPYRAQNFSQLVTEDRIDINRPWHYQ